MEEPVEISRTTPESNPEEGWFHLDVHPPVFFFSAGFILFFVIITLVFQEHMEAVFQQVQASISDYAGWLFIWTVNIVLIFILVLLGGRFGNIRLGGPDAQPEFSTVAWFSMLFSAGMGIGLLFYGVAEPMFHYAANPQAQPGTLDSARWAMDITFLHWGLHPWAIYSLVGLSLGFFAFNKGLPLSIRTAFYPLFGERIYGWVGNVIDILATVATLFGVATSLGTWRTADKCGAGSPAGNRTDRNHPGASHRQHYTGCHLVGRERPGQGDSPVERNQHFHCRASGPVCSFAWPHPLYHERPTGKHRVLRAVPSGAAQIRTKH